MEQELLTLPEHMSSPPVFNGFKKISWPPLDYLLWRRSGRFCQEFAWVENSMDLREYDTVGIANWFFHESSWFGQFRHALSKYAKKNIPSWLSFRDIYDRISTIFRQIIKIRIFIAVKKISQFQNGKR